jgi:hypothetical protein
MVAVYMHSGRTYLIADLNHTTREATATLAKLKYITKPIENLAVEADGGELLCPVHAPGEHLSYTSSSSLSLSVSLGD